jgi:hypothetical protein
MAIEIQVNHLTMQLTPGRNVQLVSIRLDDFFILINFSKAAFEDKSSNCKHLNIG